MSALASIVASLGELSESELQQLYLMVGVRLGIPGGSTPGGNSGGARASGKTTKPKPTGGKTSKSISSSQGNPKRKSQWANHPLYVEYSRLKKVVEKQAKDSKTSFNAVDTAESRAYRQAFSQWLEAKSSFRGHGESGQIRAPPGERKKGDEESSDGESEEEAEAGPSIPPVPGSPIRAPEPPLESAKRTSPPTGRSGKSTGSPSHSGKARSK
jgi:hypothetical protein